MSVQELRGGARMVLCASVSWYLAVELHIDSAPVAAVLPAVFTLAGIPLWAPRLGFYRLGGVLLGVGIGALALRWLPVSVLSLALVVSVGYLAGLLLRIDGAPSPQVVVSAVLVFGVPVAGYPEQRLLENLVGIAVVVLLGPLLWPPDPCAILSRRLDAYRERLDRLLRRHAVQGAPPAADRDAGTAEDLWQQPRDLERDLRRARQALRWSVLLRRSAPALEEVGHRIHLAERTAAPLHCLTAQLRPADDRDPFPDAVRHALVDALAGADPTEPIARARAIGRRHGPAAPGSQPDLAHGILLLVLDTLDEYRRAHFPGP
ncbi:hypothetical protein ACGFNQ_22925 [Streptomyces asoensis]|uniref:hypothetical protein n=1 Tax=Streptomyces asoensis TaxID=249586 RepID=UPI00370FBCAB